MRVSRAIAAIVLSCAASPAHADVVWPALLLEYRILSLPVIGAGLLVEFVALKLLFDLKWDRALLAAVTVNAISAVFGIVLIPLGGIAWEVGPGLLMYRLANLGTFNPATWAATFVLATAISTGIEGFCLIRIFKLRLDRRRWLLWAGVNAVTVGFAFLSLALFPAQP